jgi:23S rRNA (pseudouridine1915-N3)-methyltransferase
MQIDLVTIGKIKDPYLRDGIAEYRKRVSGFCQLTVVEHAEERVKEGANATDIRLACMKEGKLLLKSSEGAGMMIALDPAGKHLSSENFAAQVKSWEINGPHHIAILIGGPHGLSDEVRTQTSLLLSLSMMTFPHQLVRLILLEQIYRAYTIVKGLPYHR